MSSMDDMMGAFFGGQHVPEAQEKTPEKGVPWHAKEIDGVLYVRLADVAELLKQNDVLPAVRAGIERRL